MQVADFNYWPATYGQYLNERAYMPTTNLTGFFVPPPLNSTTTTINGTTYIECECGGCVPWRLHVDCVQTAFVGEGAVNLPFCLHEPACSSQHGIRHTSSRHLYV